MFSFADKKDRIQRMEFKLNAKQLRSNHRPSTIDQSNKRNQIYIILDDVLDTYNIGAVFRLADAVAAKKVYLCGGTETPPNPRIKKSSINTTEIVDWEYSESTLSVIKNLKFEIKNLKVVAIEQDSKSIPYNEYNYELPIALVVGNESLGISKEVLEKCDAIVEMPMFGINVSLNVMVSLAIVLYKALE